MSGIAISWRKTMPSVRRLPMAYLVRVGDRVRDRVSDRVRVRVAEMAEIGGRWRPGVWHCGSTRGK